MNLTEAFNLITAAAVSVGVVGFIARLFANTIASVAIKKFELINSKELEDLKLEHQRELEGIKYQIGKLQKEHEIAFSSLYTKREDVISKLYKLMIDVVEVTGKKSINENIDISTAFSELQVFFDLNRLYFPGLVALEINQVINTSYSLAHADNDSEYQKLATQLKIEVFDKMEHTFRQMLKTEDHR